MSTVFAQDGRVSRIRRCVITTTLPTALVLILAVVTVSMMFVTPLAQAQTQPPTTYSLKVLHSFNGTDGSDPTCVPIRDAEGNIYGTSEFGGDSGYGLVFKVDARGNETGLHSFNLSDGALPVATLLKDASGNLYGTTPFGGNLSACNGSGCGEVFKIDTSGTFTVLYAFTGTNGDGIEPVKGLIQDSAGNLYGTTSSGGTGICTWNSGGCGTVFKIDPRGKETVLYSFTGTGGDGAVPYTSLVLDATGYLWGTTYDGGNYSGVCTVSVQNGCGTVWKLNPTTGKETVLHHFNANRGDGAHPNAGGYMDAHGNFYGTTPYGGNITACPSNSSTPGCGLVFRIDSSGKYTVLHKFGVVTFPEGPLIQDKEGNFYGAAFNGGTYGFGVVYKMSTSDNKHFLLTNIFSFTGDGAEPHGPSPVIRDAHGTLYGFSGAGGGTWNAGTVFKLTPR